MKTSTLALAAGLVVALGTGLSFANHAPQEDLAMTTRARGPFDVKVAPLAQEPFPDGLNLGRFSLDKQYHGDLEATAKGEMLTAGTPVEGSAGYVAIERVDGTLHGRRGSFALQHLGAMAHGAQQLTITVVPDSGSGELRGLSGKLAILIAPDGKHSYDLEYTLAAQP
jgi:hypothetical protein